MLPARRRLKRMRDGEPCFLYRGQSGKDIPRNVMHVKVDPEVKEIGERAFYRCHQLINVQLHEGLEHIDQWAFAHCKLLTSITIPSTVKEIGENAFSGCRQLVDVELNEGLRRIDKMAFAYCTSLTSISIPPTVKQIGGGAFMCCTQVRNVELNEGLEEIGDRAFTRCTSLQRIVIPSTVKDIGTYIFEGCSRLSDVELREGLESIHGFAFERCTLLERIRIPSTVKYIAVHSFKYCASLEAIEFCNEIEQFVNEVPMRWWNCGVSDESLRTYSFLTRCNIPSRLGAIKVQKWKDNIHDMLQSIPPTIPCRRVRRNNDEDEYFDSIESQLSNYEQLCDDVAPILELALWKAKMEEQANDNPINDEMKLQCRYNSLSMVPIIIPNALSFLCGG
jgi:hypothetical protein